MTPLHIQGSLPTSLMRKLTKIIFVKSLKKVPISVENFLAPNSVYSCHQSKWKSFAK